jgi:hypothetical protein
MTVRVFTVTLFVVAATTMPGSAQAPRGTDLQTPLVLASQGSFFVGGEKKTVSAPAGGRGGPAGEITVNQISTLM